MQTPHLDVYDIPYVEYSVKKLYSQLIEENINTLKTKNYLNKF